MVIWIAKSQVKPSALKHLMKVNKRLQKLTDAVSPIAVPRPLQEFNYSKNIICVHKAELQYSDLHPI